MITRIYDADEIKAVAKIPQIWETVAEDGADMDSWEPDVYECWLRAEDDKGMIGLFNYHQFNGSSVIVHPMVLPERRKSESVKAGIESIKWVFDNTECIKVLCFIPVIYRNVKLYALQCGLATEGKLSSIYTKHGKIHDMWTLGVSRSDFEERHHG